MLIVVDLTRLTKRRCGAGVLTRSSCAPPLLSVLRSESEDGEVTRSWPLICPTKPTVKGGSLALTVVVIKLSWTLVGERVKIEGRFRGTEELRMKEGGERVRRREV